MTSQPKCEKVTVGIFYWIYNSDSNKKKIMPKTGIKIRSQYWYSFALTAIIVIKFRMKRMLDASSNIYIYIGCNFGCYINAVYSQFPLKTIPQHSNCCDEEGYPFFWDSPLRFRAVYFLTRPPLSNPRLRWKGGIQDRICTDSLFHSRAFVDSFPLFIMLLPPLIDPCCDHHHNVY